MPYLVKKGKAFEHRLDGIRRDVGTVESYWNSQMNLLDEKQRMFFDDENWRIPAFIYTSADVKNSLISHGCKIHGVVSRSVLSSGVNIEKKAEVADSIILPNATIEKNVKLNKVIVDAGVTVTIGKMKKITDLRKADKNAIIVVGKRKIQNANDIKS